MATLTVERGAVLDAFFVVTEPKPEVVNPDRDNPNDYQRMDLSGLEARVVFRTGECGRVVRTVDSAEPPGAQALVVEPPEDDVPADLVDPDLGTRGLLWLHLGATVTSAFRSEGWLVVVLYDPLDPDQDVHAGHASVRVTG